MGFVVLLTLTLGCLSDGDGDRSSAKEPEKVEDKGESAKAPQANADDGR